MYWPVVYGWQRGAVAGHAVADHRHPGGLQSKMPLDQTLRESFDRLICNQVEHAVGMLQPLHDKGQAGEITPDQAKALGANLLRQIRYDQEGCFWADTSAGVNVVYLGSAGTEGKSRWDLLDAKGKLLVQEIIKNGMQEGGGFTDYWFPKPEQTDPLPKRGYSLYPALRLGGGQGNYTDDINAIVAAKRGEMTKLAHFTEEISGGMKEIAGGAREINLAINGISDLGVENRDQVAKLAAETDRFKVKGAESRSVGELGGLAPLAFLGGKELSPAASRPPGPWRSRVPGRSPVLARCRPPCHPCPAPRWRATGCRPGGHR